MPKELLALNGGDFPDHLDDVAQVQKRQAAILERLIEKHGLTEVFVEGVTDKDMADFELRVQSYRETVLAAEAQLAQARQLNATDIEKELVAQLGLSTGRATVLEDIRNDWAR